MKKNLKRALSVFMAVMMIMTAWVFVAPQKADAVDTGTYYWRVRVNSGNDTGGWDYGRWNVYGKSANGKGSEATITSQFDKKVDFKGEQTIKSGSSTSFPTKLTFTYSFGGGATWREMKGTAYLDVSGNNSSWTNIASCDIGAKSSAFSAAKGTKTATVGTGSYPKATSLVWDANPGNVTIPRAGASSATTTFRVHANDQYGVRIASTSSGYTRNASLNYTTGCSVAYGTTNASYEPGTITVTNDAKLAGTTDTKTVTLTASIAFNSGTASGTKTFTLTDPTYTFTYNGNGGTINQSTYSRYYGNTAATIPTSGSKTGYEFIGMYTSAKTSYDITKPVAGTTSGYTGQLTTSTAFPNNDQTWYAAWWAKNYNVTFQDNRGNTLNTITGKYDKAATALATEIAKINLNPARVPVPGETGSFNYKFRDYVVVSAKDASGNDITQSAFGESYKSYILKGETVFRAAYTVDSVNHYTVNFLYNGKSSSGSYEYGYLPTVPSDTAKATENDYEYTFKGWKIQEGSETIKIVDEGAYVPLVDDLTVRENVTYVAVYERKPVVYTITFNWKEDGATGPVDKTTTKTYHWGDEVQVPNLTTDSFYNNNGYTYRFIMWDSATDPVTKITAGNAANLSYTKRAMTYTAMFDNGTPAVYTITVVDKDGNETAVEYTHGSVVPTPADPATYRDDSNEFEYTFDHWEDQYGNTDFNNIAGANLVYTPVFNATPLYAVNYYNEDNFLGTEYYTAGSAIADPTFDEPVTKAEDMLASAYTFSAWMTGDTWSVEDGDEAVTTMPAETVDLYAKFVPTYKEYTVTFYNDTVDGEGNPTVISEKTYHYGDGVVIPADPTKPADATYSYTFKGWDKSVTARCLGDADYTATYRKEYNYYNVVWVDKDGNSIKDEYYIWNGRINTPALTIAVPDYPDDPSTAEDESTLYSYRHNGWQIVENPTIDANGKITAWDISNAGAEFVRGDRMTGPVVYMPTFEVVTKTYTVSVYNEAGTEVLYEIEAMHNEDISASTLLTEPYKAFSEDHHFTFAGWKNLDGTDANLVITDEIAIKPAFVEEAHSFDDAEIEIEKDATYFQPGSGFAVCECGYKKSVVLDTKVDLTAPEAVLYVKDSMWDTAEGTTGSDANTIRVGKYNQVIVNANDTGSGIISIGEYLSKSYIADPSTIDEANWNTTAYFGVVLDGAPVIGEDGGIQLLDENPNINGYIKDYDEDIAEGESFYLYFKIVDRAGKVAYINSDKLVYDETAPVVTFTGENRVNRKYCLDAQFTVDAGANDVATVTVDGVVVTPVDGVYTVPAANTGLHQVVATDLAGNQVKENFEVVGQHVGKIFTTSASCTEDGYTVTRCQLCSAEVGEKVVIPALEHNFGDAIIVDPTCVKDGSATYYCFRCGEKKVEVPEELEATGEHSFTDWKVIDDATCSAEGKQTRNCPICGEVEEEVIPVNPEAHRYYRGVVTKPTCTEGGYTLHTCRYNSEHTYIDAETEPTGHIEADEWTTVTDPTCTVDGLKVKYCDKGCEENGEKVVVTEETIPALTHFWKFKETVPATDTEEGYDLYVCARVGCDETDKRNYTEKLEKYDITFVDEDGTVIKKFADKVEGESITAGEIEEPTKAANETYTFSFKEWVDEDGTKVDLPIIVSKALTLKAVYTPKYINYTVVLNNEDNATQFKKIGYLHMGQTITEADAPAKASDDMYDYTFAGWTTGEEGYVASTEITITGDMTLYATYTQTEREYTVTFADKDDNALAILKGVVAGTDVVYDAAAGKLTYTVYDKTGSELKQVSAEKDLAVPTKAFDNAAHYEFAGWTADLTNIMAPTLAKPVFTAIAHTYTSEVTQAQSCTEDQMTKYTCDCGHTFTEKTADALGHSWGEPVDGIVTCIRCGETSEDFTVYTVKFIGEDGTTVIKTIANIRHASDISKKVPTAAEMAKESTAYLDFTFEGWTLTPGGDVVTVETIVKDNATYYAKYSSADRYYKVIFAYDANNVIKVYNNVLAGSKVVYDGKQPTKAGYDDYGHYVFAGWSVDTSKVLADTYVTAKFNTVDHNFGTPEKIDATCTHGAGTIYKCACGYSYVVSNGKPLKHEYQLDEKTYVEPDLEKPGYEKYVCKYCGDVIEKNLPAKEYFYVTIVVQDSNHEPVSGARVSLFDKGVFVASGKTDSNGKVIIRVTDKKDFTIVIDRDDFGSVTGIIKVNDDGSVDMSNVPQIKIVKCTCTCHGGGFWPSIFRFFHKLIKMMTGSFSCCGDPDPRY